MLSIFGARSFVCCNRPHRNLETNHTWILAPPRACLNFYTKHILVPHAVCYSSITFITSSPESFTLSYVFSMILLSSVRRTGHPWQTCQFWCSLVNPNQAACCWTLSRGPTRGYRSIFYPRGFLTLKSGLKPVHQLRVIASASSPTCTKVQIPVGLMFSYRRVSGHSFGIS